MTAMPLLANPLADSKFALNALEFVGLIGGTEVISVMTMIPLYRGRRWLGWYNTPGSLDIARHLSAFASSLQPRHYENISPATLLGLDSEVGPTFTAAFSGMETQTGHVGYLTIERSKEMGEKERDEWIPCKGTLSTPVILLDFQKTNLECPLPLLHIGHTLLALIPIVTSVATCLLCGFISDWYMFSVILVGIFTSGVASMVIGSGSLDLAFPMWPASGAPPGNGVFISENSVVIVRGDERTISAITRGKFRLVGGSKRWRVAIHLCSVLYLAECVAQFILIPQGTLFGQIMFIVSLSVSWAYSYRLSSFKKQKLQAEVLFSKLGKPNLRKFRVGTRPTTAVFACLLLFHGVRHLASANEYDRILSALLPSTSRAWGIWREKVIRQLITQEDDTSLSHLAVTGDHELSPQESHVLQAHLGDAKEAFGAYLGIHGSLPTSSGMSFKGMP